MTTSAVGRVIDEHGVGLPKLGVVLHGISPQFDVKLGKPKETIKTTGNADDEEDWDCAADVMPMRDDDAVEDRS